MNEFSDFSESAADVTSLTGVGTEMSVDMQNRNCHQFPLLLQLGTPLFYICLWIT